MKHTSQSIRLILVFIVLICLNLNAVADVTMTVNAILYREVSKSPLRVMVAKQNSQSLTNLDVPASVRWIGTNVTAQVAGVDQMAFRKTFVKSVAFAQPGTEIGIGAFDGCIVLSTVSLPASSVIDQLAFLNCTSLKAPVLPDSVQIKAGAFYGCTHMENIVIPRDTKFISGQIQYMPTSSGESIVVRERVFGACALKSVTAVNPIPVDAPEDTFFGSYDATLIVPKGSAKLYKTAKEWERFTNIVEDESIGALYDVSFSITEGGKVLVNNVSLNEGNTHLSFEKGTDVAIRITPDAGCYIKTFNINGISHLSDLNEESYVINGLGADTEVTVEFESTKVGIDVIGAGDINLYKEGNDLVVSSSDTDIIEVSNASGGIVYRGLSGRIPLSAKGLYLVRVGNRSFKILM